MHAFLQLTIILVPLLCAVGWEINKLLNNSPIVLFLCSFFAFNDATTSRTHTTNNGLCNILKSRTVSTAVVCLDNDNVNRRDVYILPAPCSFDVIQTADHRPNCNSQFTPSYYPYPSAIHGSVHYFIAGWLCCFRNVVIVPDRARRNKVNY